MKFVKISFESEEATVKAYYEMAKRGKVISLAHDQFIVPEPALTWLKDHGIAPTILERLNQDDVVQALRDSLTHPV